MDGKIHDGVHVLSLSIGDPLSLTFSVDDVIGIGDYNAMIREIIVVCGAGNCEHITQSSRKHCTMDHKCCNKLHGSSFSDFHFLRKQ